MGDRPYFGGSGGVRSGFVGSFAGARSPCMNSRHRIDWLGVRLLRGIALYIGFTECFVGIRPTTSPRTSTTRLNRNESLANLSIIIAIGVSMIPCGVGAQTPERVPACGFRSGCDWQEMITAAYFAVLAVEGRNSRGRDAIP